MNKKTLIWFGAVIIIIVVISGIIIYRGVGKPLGDNNFVIPATHGATSPRDATYTIEGQPVTLKDGVSITSTTPNSASTVATRYFGNEAYADFDGDGRKDVVFLVTQDTGGSGVFYYVVVALNTINGYVGSSAYFLGDRIAPQTTEIDNKNVITVNFADRNQMESYVTKPSLGVSRFLYFDVKTRVLNKIFIDP